MISCFVSSQRWVGDIHLAQWHLPRHSLQWTTDKLMHTSMLQRVTTRTISTEEHRLSAAAVTTNAICAATAAIMAAEQRPVGAGMRARHRLDEVRRELGGIFGVQRKSLWRHSRVNAQLQAKRPACWVGKASVQQ